MADASRRRCCLCCHKPLRSKNFSVKLCVCRLGPLIIVALSDGRIFSFDHPHHRCIVRFNSNDLITSSLIVRLSLICIDKSLFTFLAIRSQCILSMYHRMMDALSHQIKIFAKKTTERPDDKPSSQGTLEKFVKIQVDNWKDTGLTSEERP